MNTVSGGMFPRGLLGPADSVSVIDNCRPFTCSSNRLARRGLAILSLCASRVKDGKNGKKEGKRREWLYAGRRAQMISLLRASLNFTLQSWHWKSPISTFFFDLPPFNSQTFAGLGTSAPHFGQTTL